MEPAENRRRRIDIRTGYQGRRHYGPRMAGRAGRLLYQALRMRRARVLYRSMGSYGQEEFQALLEGHDRISLNLQQFSRLDPI